MIGIFIFVLILLFSSNVFLSKEETSIREFKDEELGISFQYPKSWGDVGIKDTYAYTEVFREIYFSTRPDVKLFATTKDYSYPQWFKNKHIANTKDLDAFCGGYFWTEGENSNGEDMFRSNGSYTYGNCSSTTTKPFINSASKILSGHDDGRTTIEDPTIIPSTIALSQSMFRDLPGDVYPMLTLFVELPVLQSNEFCTRGASYVDGTYRFRKSFECINYKEKEVIESSFDTFEASSLKRELNQLLDSVVLLESPDLEGIYGARFSEKASFVDTLRGIQFLYPKVWGAPTFDPVSQRRITFTNGEEAAAYGSFSIEMTSYNDALAYDEEQKTCGGDGCGFGIGTIRWRQDYDAINTNSIGDIVCPSSSRNKKCTLKDVNGQKTLVIYYSDRSTEGGVQKEYVMYSANGTRFTIHMGSQGIWSYDVDEYQELEKTNTDFGAQIDEEVVRSIKLK